MAVRAGIGIAVLAVLTAAVLGILALGILRTQFVILHSETILSCVLENL